MVLIGIAALVTCVLATYCIGTSTAFGSPVGWLTRRAMSLLATGRGTDFPLISLLSFVFALRSFLLRLLLLFSGSICAAAFPSVPAAASAPNGGCPLPLQLTSCFRAEGARKQLRVSPSQSPSALSGERMIKSWYRDSHGSMIKLNV